MITNAGHAYFRGRVEGGTALYSGTLYMALSTDNTAPNASDTTIAGEQTTLGLARAAVTATHTAGQNTWTFANTFTYSGAATVNVNKIALFDAAAGGNLITEDVIPQTTFQNAGDNAPMQVVFSI